MWHRQTSPERIEFFSQPGIGEAVQAIAPNQRGRVRFRASFWPARFYSDVKTQTLEAHTRILPSDQVAVVGRDGITLLVTPITPSAQIA